MSTENILRELTTQSGYLGDRTVYFGDVHTEKINGIPWSNIKSEGNERIAPISFNEIESVAKGMQKINQKKDKEIHDYNYYLQNKKIEENGLSGNSTNNKFFNSAIGSKSGAYFGNQINILSVETNEQTKITPFTTSTNVLLTDEIRIKTEKNEEPSEKRIKLQNNVCFAQDSNISFENNNNDKKTVISQGRIITSQIGEDDELMKIKANEIEIESDVVMGNTNKFVTSHLHADEQGVLDIKADQIHFTANQITFDPESTEITTGNFPQIITNLKDYESIQKTSVNIFSDPKLRTDPKKSVLDAAWRLQMFYNVIVIKIIFNKLNENNFITKMKDVITKDLYLQFPSDYYNHFVDYFGREDEDYYITETELLMQKNFNNEIVRKKISIYFNPKINNFLKLKLYSSNGEQEIWMNSFMGYSQLKFGNINFGLAVSSPRLKKQYVPTTPANFMKKPDFFETITPRKQIKISRTNISNIFTDNKEQMIKINDELNSNYQLQATVTATKLHRIAFYDIHFSFVNVITNQLVPYNEVMRVMKNYDKNPEKFLITFIPSGEMLRFNCSDETNTEHVATHPITDIKFIYNPKFPHGLTKGILDFSNAKPLPCDDDVSLSLQFWEITK